MPDPETTGQQREVGFRKPPVEHQFKPGNPGRPKGSRNKLSEDFFRALAEDFATHGAQAIIDMRTNRPGDYAKMVAGLQTKEMTGEDGAPIAFTQRIELIGVRPGDDG